MEYRIRLPTEETDSLALSVLGVCWSRVRQGIMIYGFRCGLKYIKKDW